MSVEKSLNCHYHGIRKNIIYGAFAGFFSSFAFAAIMLWLPIIFGIPVGTFMDTLGALILTGTDDIVKLGFTAFGLIISQGIIVGIIFAIVTSKIKKLNLTNKKKCIGLGLAGGLVSFVVLLMPLAGSAYYELVSKSLQTYPESALSTQGFNNFSLKTPSYTAYYFNMLAWGLFAYLVFGLFLGGIIRWAYAIYNYDIDKINVLHSTP